MGSKVDKVRELEAALERAKREAEEEAVREEELHNKPIFDAISAAFNVGGRQISFDEWENPTDAIECSYAGRGLTIYNAGSVDTYICIYPSPLHDVNFYGAGIDREDDILSYLNRLESEAKSIRDIMERFGEYQEAMCEGEE